MERVKGFGALAFAWVAAAACAQPTARPNILFFFADDWGRYASVYAKAGDTGGLNDAVRTPAIDRLAERGVLFRHAHVSAPSCTPCRSALLSGQHFYRTERGSILRGAVWNPSIPSYPLLLRDAGYFIGKAYKVWSPGTPADAPYGGQTYAYETAGKRFNRFSQSVTQRVAEGCSVEAAKEEIYSEIRRNFGSFLSACRQSGKPFCFWFGPTNTHRDWTRGSGQALWGLDPDTLKGKLPPFLPDVPEVREDMADYLGEAMAFDAGVGVLMEELEKSGQAGNTLIVISGDHGTPGFLHGKCNLYDFGTGVALVIAGPGVKGGRVVDDMVSLTDLAPTFLEAAGLPVPEVMTGHSLWPVLRSEKSGQVDPSRTWVISGRERHVENAREGYLPYPQRCLRTEDYAYVVNFKPDRWPMGEPYRLDGARPPSFDDVAKNTRITLEDEDAGPTKAWVVTHRDDPAWHGFYERAYGKRPRAELYDLKADPYEVKNLAQDPAYAQTCREMEARLFSELRRTGDPRMTGDGRYFETPPLAGPLAEGGPSPEELRAGR